MGDLQVSYGLSGSRVYLHRGSGAGTSGAAAKVAIVCNRETIAPTIEATIAPIVARSATILAIVGAVVGAIVSRLQTIATFAAAPLVPAPLPRLRSWTGKTPPPPRVSKKPHPKTQ